MQREASGANAAAERAVGDALRTVHARDFKMLSTSI